MPNIPLNSWLQETSVCTKPLSTIYFFLEIAEILLDYKITPWEKYVGQFQDILVVISTTNKKTFFWKSFYLKGISDMVDNWDHGCVST